MTGRQKSAYEEVPVLRRGDSGRGRRVSVLPARSPRVAVGTIGLRVNRSSETVAGCRRGRMPVCGSGSRSTAFLDGPEPTGRSDDSPSAIDGVNPDGLTGSIDYTVGASTCSSELANAEGVERERDETDRDFRHALTGVANQMAHVK